jgi:calcineurin-like phosphoesterase family protein
MPLNSLKSGKEPAVGKRYLLSDTHFCDERILRYESRPFASVQEMDTALIEHWNGIVKSEDTVFVLGDFSAGDEETTKEILSLLQGEKVLVMGNHDQQRTPLQWRTLGFSEVSRWPILYEDFYILSHEPVYICNTMPYANIFGHVHGNPAYKDYSSQSFCVSVERINYTPILFEDIKLAMILETS